MPKPAQVLVIGDDHQILRLFSQILVDGGLSVAVADSGTKALDLLRRQTFKLVVVDMSTPNHDGFEVLKTIQSLPNYPKVLALVRSLKGELADAADFPGADATLSKNDVPDLLLGTARLLLG